VDGADFIYLLPLAAYQVIIAHSEDKLQKGVCKLSCTARKHNLNISTEKAKVTTFAGNEPIKAKITMDGI
jgi:hypothetical protein